MWAEFVLTTILATVLLAPELRRLASAHGGIFVAVVGTAAVLTVSAWLLMVFILGSLLTHRFKALEFWSLLATFALPLSIFLLAHRRFSVVVSLIPAGLMLLIVTFVYIVVAIKLAYGMPHSDLHTILEPHLAAFEYAMAS